MSKPVCKVCGTKMMRNGTTSAGTQRWRCGACGSSSVRHIDSSAKWLDAFLRWLLGKASQAEFGMAARTFRKRTSAFWSLWPILPICDEIHHVVYMDGLWLTRKCVILIACTDEHVIGCHLAKSENSKDWACLMRRIAPPDVLVCDGGGGIEKARRARWPKTRVQRCCFHAFEQVKRCTTTRPKLQAGVELYGIARALLRVGNANEAAAWLASFSNWCTEWEGFLKERTVVDGRSQYKHEPLRRARRGLERLCREGTLFTYLDEGLLLDGSIPATSNRIESMNAQVRAMLRNHRGLNVDHRVKAVFWWCYVHSETPPPAARMLKELPDDEAIREWRRMAAKANGDDTGVPARWGEGLVWSEFHHSTPYPFTID